MNKNILDFQPINNICKAIKIFNKSMAESKSKQLSLLDVYNAGVIDGKRQERAKQCKN